MRWTQLTALLALSCSCSAPPRPGGQPSLTPRPAASPEAWRYEVAALHGGAELDVRAWFPRGSSAELSVDDGAEPFVRDVAVADRGGWKTVAARDASSWVVPACASVGCQIRYRFDLAEAARAIAEIDTAIAADGAFLAPPSTWLLRPLAAPPNGDERFRLRVTTSKEAPFVSGLTPESDVEVARGHEPDESMTTSYVARVSDLPVSPYSAFGRLRQHTLAVGSGAQTLTVAFAGPELEVGDAALLRWMARKASVVARYYGQFPVDRALILVVGTRGARFEFGKTLGNGGASIVLPMGRATPPATLASDWVLVHEMMHLGFPSLAHQHSWLEEGMATYLEPLARARAGDLGVEEVWRGLVEGLPHGLPLPGDAGLEGTHTWGRVYWGGALFCLLADIAIREQTHNERTLDHAIRGIVAAGGTVAERWDIARVIAVGDRSTGTAVLADLYRKMSLQPFVVDLDALWKRLGIRMSGRRVIFDGAPLSYVRQAMTAR